jgi:proteasome lid subunit RPN8/RPN11
MEPFQHPFLTDRDILRAIEADARARFPIESCGAITPEGYLPLENKSPAPEISFDCSAACADLQAAGALIAVVHSHPNGPVGPGLWDMRMQMGMDIPWGLCAVSERGVSPVFFWGDSLPIPPLVQRPFRHGPSGTDGAGDCYALIRDWYRLERQVTLPDFPRDDNWWEKPDGENNIYVDNFAKAGFVQIDSSAPEPGDVVLCAIKSKVPNHGMVYLGNGLIIHHLSTRLSQITPIAAWQKFIRMWLRKS